MDPDLLKCWRAEAKILVVDDEDFLVEIIREKLELEGFQTEGAGNGVEALERRVLYRNRFPGMIS